MFGDPWPRSSKQSSCNGGEAFKCSQEIATMRHLCCISPRLRTFHRTSFLLSLRVLYLFTTDNNVNLKGQLLHSAKQQQLRAGPLSYRSPYLWFPQSTQEGSIYPVPTYTLNTTAPAVWWKQMTLPTGLRPHVECNIWKMYGFSCRPTVTFFI